METRSARPFCQRCRYLQVLAGLVLLLVLLGWPLRDSMLDKARTVAEQELLGNAKVVRQEVLHWLEDQRLLGGHPRDSGLARDFQHWLRHGGSTGQMEERLAWLTDRSDRYRGAWVADARGQVHFGRSTEGMAAPQPDAGLLRRVEETGTAGLMDLGLDYRGRPYMASVNPLLVSEAGGQRLVGFVILGIDPGRHLYPLLQLAHYGNPRIETVLARREGNAIRYLNPLQGHPQPMQLRLDAAGRLLSQQTPGPELQVLGGLDYRGVEVVGVVQLIPDMDWILVTKMDREAIDGPALRQFYQFGLTLLTLLTVLGLFLWLSRRYLNAQRGLAQVSRDLERERLEKVFDFLVHYANDIVLLMDEAGNILEANDAASRAYGYSRSELVRMNIAQLRAPDTLGLIHKQLAAAGNEGGYSFKTRHLRRDGSEFPVEVSSGTFEERGVRYRQSIIRDISQREAVALALAQSEARFRSLIELAAVGLAEMTPDHRWLEVNPALCEILGYEREGLLQKSWEELVHPEDLPRESALCRELLAGEREEYKLPLRFIHAGGSTVWGNVAVRSMDDARGRHASLVLIVHDITSLIQQEEQLREALERQIELNHRLEEAQSQLLQSEKMASIGQLAAGVAHEINNPVGFVSSNLGTLKTYLDDLMAIIDAALARNGNDPELRTLLAARDFPFLREDAPALVAESLDGIARVKKIVQDLKDFSRVGEADWQWADLHQGLESTLNIVWNEIKYKARVDKHYGDLPRIWCLPSQLNQVFMNLLVNAAHAIERQGVITLRSGTSPDGVWVEVEDTGHGIAPEHLGKIFDPFFTTKPVGQGTGLGLSLAFSIVRKHGGHIEVHSEPGQGTRFRVWLPRIPPEASPPAEAPEPPISSEVNHESPPHPAP